MTDDPPPELSGKTLTGFFRDALQSGGKEPPPAAPEWFSQDDFPYEVSRFVGRGGSGLVWRAERRDGSGPVALKVVSFKGHQRLRRRWENECETLSRVDHPNLVGLIDFGLAPDFEVGWMALEWIEGPDLATLLADRGSLSVAEVAEFLPQITSALSALHEADLVHRDIKPANLLLEKTNKRWVLADFGLAYEVGQDAEARLTRTLEAPATPGYAAPEREQPGVTCDARSDQYSLAFTLWEMLSGTRPLGSVPKLHTLARVPGGIDFVLRKALAHRPQDRFRDLRRFERAFLRAVRRPPWLRPLLFVFVLAVLGLALSATIQRALEPPPFPREFRSGPLEVTKGREHFMEVDLTLQEDGQFHAVMRSWSAEALYGFTGQVHLIWRDADGAILKDQKSSPIGVNGRLIIGAPYERLDHWHDRLPPDMAARVERVDFLATPDGISQEARENDNRRQIQDDLKKIREVTGKGWDAFLRMLREPEPPQSPDPDLPRPRPDRAE